MTYKLTFEDAVNIWERASKGEYQFLIAADYLVNQGRVNEVLKGKRLIGSEEEFKRRNGIIK